MVSNGVVDAKLNLLRVNKHKLQLVWMLLVEKRGYDGIQTNRLALACGTGHKEVRHLCEVSNVDIVGDGLSERYRQVILTLFKLTRVENALHRHDVLLLVRHLYTYRSFARYRSYNTNAESAKAEGDIVFKVTNFRDAHALGRCHLIERDGGAYSCFYLFYAHAKTVEHFYNASVVAVDLVHVDCRPGVVLLF